MKKALLLSGFLALGAVASYGSVIDTCSTDGTLAAVIAAHTCEVGDKVFTFASDAYAPGTTDGTAADVQVQGFINVPGETFGLQFINSLTTGWNSNFTLAFSVSIDQTACLALYTSSHCVITGTQDQFQGGQAGSSNTAALTGTHTVGGTLSLDAHSTNDETGQITGLNQTTMADSFSGTASSSWSISRFGTEVFQVAVPEPMTFSLMGAGLLGLGLLRKRIGRS